jgi:pSer/pThr/pTyr-binding forkhead associated (FHA) protein
LGKTKVNQSIHVMIMSGVEDGALFDFSPHDGSRAEGHWTLSLGRRDQNDLCLRNDSFVSRLHAYLHWKDGRWWLEDCDSTNGTFVENPDDFFDDTRVKGIIPLEVGQLFRVGRTWLRIQPE